VELSQLRYFLTVAARGSFTRASADLGITQPALSRSVAKLEAELGQPLFERLTRTVVLTPAGRRFQARAVRILALADDAAAEMADDGETGLVRVGAIPTIAPYFLPALLLRFQAECPKAQVVVAEETTDRLLQRCRQGEVDVALLAAPVPAGDLQVEPLFDEELLLVLPAGHALARKKQVPLEQLREFPFVLLEETHCLSGAVIALCRQRSFQPVNVERTSQLATVKELVSLGHGVSLIPQMARRLDRDPRRVYRAVVNPAPRRSIVLAWNPHRFQSRLLERFKACVRGASRGAE
jgi:LysR family hydrogen peroxide-inducible transcriptional activator